MLLTDRQTDKPKLPKHILLIILLIILYTTKFPKLVYVDFSFRALLQAYLLSLEYFAAYTLNIFL